MNNKLEGTKLHKKNNKKTSLIFSIALSALIVFIVFLPTKAIMSTNGISLFATGVSSGTVEATEFCTGDGESNCISDFSAISSASSVGSVTCFAQSTLPSGYLETTGQAVSRTTYSSLFSTISTNYGTGDGSTTFNIPNKTNPFIASNSGHRYYRWYITSKTPVGSERFIEVAEVNFKVNGSWRGNKNGSVGPWSVSTNSSSCYSSETPCSSGTSNAFTHADLINGSDPEYYASNSTAYSNSGTYTGSEWIEFDFGTKVAITGFSIHSKGHDNAPGTWYLAYSDDDSTYTMIEESEVPDSSGTGFAFASNVRFTYEWDGNYGICGIKY